MQFFMSICPHIPRAPVLQTLQAYGHERINYSLYCFYGRYAKMAAIISLLKYRWSLWFLQIKQRILNRLKTKSRLLYLKTQFVPRSKHFSSRL